MDSISALVTISSLILTLVANSAVAGTDADEFVREALGAGVTQSMLSVTGEVAIAFRDTLGTVGPREVKYYHSPSNGTVWLLSARGKHGPIKVAFVVEQSRIRDCRILKDRERRGRATRSNGYLRQFVGLSLAESGRLNERVDAVTGATVSSRAVEKMAVLALRLDAIAYGPGKSESPEQGGDE